MNEPLRTRRVFRFGPFELDAEARVLLRDGQVLPVTPKAVDTLAVLVEHAGAVVTRDALLEQVWPGAEVEPNNIAQHVAALRRLFDDRRPPARFIETVARRGYRFVAPVALEAAMDRAAALPIPEIHYARSAAVSIAYQVVGSGPIDLVFVMGWVSHLEQFWTEPGFAKFLRRLASFSRLILFDKRGTGLSDRVPELPTLEQRMDDVRAVMEAAGSREAALLGVSEGGPMCALFAATPREPARS